MLTLRAAKGADYYERAEFARDDYYEERGQVRGSWEGRGALALELSESPSDGALGELLDGRDPRSGAELAGAARRRGGNVAFDLTFAAPKSVSVLAAVGDEGVRQAVLAAQAEGARAGLDYLERRACFVRRGRNGVTVLPAEGFVGAMYLHEMARSGDPHLHAHVVIANRVKGPDGRWSAPDMRPVFAEAKTAGTIADAVIRDRLTRSLGVEWGPVRNGIAEIVGVPKRVRDHFSARHAEIVEEAALRGYSGHAALDAIQRETRDAKRVVSRERAVVEWRARAAEQGLGVRETAALLGQARLVGPAEKARRLHACEERMLGAGGLTERSAHFTRREAIQALAEAHPEGAPLGTLEHLADSFLERSCVSLAPSLVEPTGGHREALYSTPEMLRVEARLLETCAGADPSGPIAALPAAVEAVIARRSTLGADQAEAVRHLCAGEGRVRLLEARAGTGKTFALEAVRDAYEASGVMVVGVAWQGQAADVLQREAGIPSQTAALLLQRIALGQSEAMPEGGVVICDEASMMPTRALERLADEAAGRRTRLLLVGDRAQLPAIDAAGAFAALADRLGAAELRENRRQRTPLQRQVAERLADERTDDALDLLAHHGRLLTFEDGREARQALIDAWARTSLMDPAASLMLAHDRQDVRLLNELARARLEEAGLLGPTRITVEGREWAAGDRLVCRRNDYRLGVRNGTRATVVQVDPGRRELVVRTDDGRGVRLPSDYLSNAHHGYAVTGHISQGTTVERTFLLATPERGGREWAYVAGTRQRVDLQLFAVHPDLEGLRQALSRSWRRTAAKQLALDLVAHDIRARAEEDAGIVPADQPATVEASAEELRAQLGRLRQTAGSVADAEIAELQEHEAALQRAEAALQRAMRREERLVARASEASRWWPGRRREALAAAARVAGEIEMKRAAALRASDAVAEAQMSSPDAVRANQARAEASAIAFELQGGDPSSSGPASIARPSPTGPESRLPVRGEREGRTGDNRGRGL